MKHTKIYCRGGSCVRPFKGRPQGSPLQKLYRNKIIASIPGSLMLFGEHAVLHGGLAIVQAVDRFITVTLSPRSDQQINIGSQGLGKMSFPRRRESSEKHEADIKKFKFIFAAIKLYENKIKYGFDLEIKSDFSAKLGLGSSAAVTVATISVLEEWITGIKPNKLKLFKNARRVIQTVQGVGSGADAAASVYGGTVAYKMQPLKIIKLKNKLPLTVVYSGSKLPTTEVLALVKKSQIKHPKIYKELYSAINHCSEEAVKAINKKDFVKLGELMNIHQGLQDALGVNNKILSELIYDLRATPGIYGAKISGSGLGDCVIGLGRRK